MINEWAVKHHGVIFRLLDDLERYRLKGSYGGELDLTLIQNIIGGGYKEVSRLQDQITLLDKKYDDLTKLHEEMVGKISDQGTEGKE